MVGFCSSCKGSNLLAAGSEFFFHTCCLFDNISELFDGTLVLPGR